MAQDVQGVPLTDFEDTIRGALNDFAYYSEDHVSFDIDEAVNLELKPDKTYSARSSSAVTHLGVKAAELVIVVFAPGEGTGNDDMYKVDEVDMGGFPDEPWFLPRSKKATYAEAYLSIGAKSLVNPDLDPVRHANNLVRTGVSEDGTLLQTARLGHTEREFLTAMQRGFAHRKAYFTTSTGPKGQREGDPHAVVSIRPDVIQVAGFIGISPEAPIKHRAMFGYLGVSRPSVI